MRDSNTTRVKSVVEQILVELLMGLSYAIKNPGNALAKLMFKEGYAANVKGTHLAWIGI